MPVSVDIIQRQVGARGCPRPKGYVRCVSGASVRCVVVCEELSMQR